MTNRSYINFDLSIEHDEDTYRAHVLQSCAGEGQSEFVLPFLKYELENFALKIGHSRRGSRRKARGSDSPELSAAKEFGARLFSAVFQGDVYACLRASLDEARVQGQGLRFLLRLPPELVNLPWEYLYNPAWNQFFALSTLTPLVRYLELTPDMHPLAMKPPLRVLVVISSPNDYQALDVEREWLNLQGALQPLVTRGLVEIERLSSPSLLALQHQLRRGEYHIFHFIGHGTFDESAQDGLLLFADEQGRGRPLSGQYLGTLLRDHSSLRLAVLNACEGARTGSEDQFAGAAYSLVQMGLPAVIAMQFEISDVAAILFAQEFYTALADGYPLDAALTDARKAIFASGCSVEWGTPVLFSRVMDSRIFDLSPVSMPVAPLQPGPAQPPAAVPASNKEISDRIPPTAVVHLYEDGLSAMQLEDWPRAHDKFQAVLKARPGYRDAAERLAQAQRQIDLDRRYQQGLQLLEDFDWAGALEVLEGILVEDPDYRDVAQRLEKAREQAYELPGLYRDALLAMDAQRWGEAHKLLGQIRKTQPGYRDSDRLLEKVDAEIERQGRRFLAHPAKSPRRWWLVLAFIFLLTGLLSLAFAWGAGLLGGGVPTVPEITPSLVGIATSLPSPVKATPEPTLSLPAPSPVPATPTFMAPVALTLTPPATLAPTATTSPTSTPTLTLIPTRPSLPVAAGTPIPAPPAAISPENAGRLVEYARWSTSKLYPWSDDLAVSPDGKWIAIASASGWTVYDAQTFREVRRVNAVNPYPKIAFSPDSRILAVGAYNQDVSRGLISYPIRLWDVSSGALVARWEQLNPINQIVFSPDGKLLALALDQHTIKILQVVDGSPVITLEDRGEIVAGIAFSPDGKTLASASYTEKPGANAASGQIGSAENVTVRLWNLADGGVIYTFVNYHTTRIGYLSFSPDGRWLASGAADRIVRLWDVADPKPLYAMAGQTSVSGVAFSPNGKLLVSASENDIRVWRPLDGSLVQVVKIAPRGVRFLTFLNDALFLAALDDGSIQVWGVE